MRIPPEVAGTSFQFSDTVKLLGVELDQALSMDRHVSSVVSSCNFHIRALRHICPRLTLDVAKSVAVSIIGACLDYHNHNAVPRYLYSAPYNIGQWR